jgi:hypothetical protein
MEVSIRISRVFQELTAVQSNPSIDALELHRIFATSNSANAFTWFAECLRISESGDGNVVGNMASFWQARDRRTATLLVLRSQIYAQN